jgi:PRTRC genetic system protein C
MALKRSSLQRKFTFDGRPLADPDPNLSIDQVRQFYATEYPALNNASYEEEVTDTAVVIKFTTAVGSKG